MENGNALRLPGLPNSILVLASQYLVERFQTCVGRRRNAKLLAELSVEQMIDCGIETPSINIPTIEVRKGLMQKLTAMN